MRWLYFGSRYGSEDGHSVWSARRSRYRVRVDYLRLYSSVTPPRIVLVRTKEPGNIGSSARIMKNFGLESLYLVAPRRPLNAQAYALATHAGKILEQAQVCETLTQATSGCTLVLGTTARPRSAGSQPALTPREGVAMLSGESAIVFGPEDFGLANEDLDHCQGYITIPTTSFSSLNLAQAVGVVTYEWFLAQQAPTPAEPRTLAPRQDYEAMYRQLREVLYLISYTDEAREATAMRRLRSIFDRAALNPEELAAVRGLWSQMRWAARHRH